MTTGRVLLIVGGAVAGALLLSHVAAGATASTSSPGAAPPRPPASPGNSVDGLFTTGANIETQIGTVAGNAFHIPGASVIAKANPLAIGAAIGSKVTPYTTPVIRGAAHATVSAVKSVGSFVSGLF